MKKNHKKFNWEVISLLWLAFFFNQADRQIFNVALPIIKLDLELSDTQLGLISSVFILAIGVMVPVAGYVGDKFSKKGVIIFSVLIWSLSTLLTGFSGGIITLIILRSIVGGSEAFYAPAANALIGEKFNSKIGLAMAIHQTALYAGIIGSGFLGAYISENYGWRTAFFIFGGIGVLLFLLMYFRLEDGKRREKREASVSLISGVRLLLQKKTAVLLTGAFSCMVFVNVGYLTWTPTFLHEKFSLSVTEAGFSSMFYHHIFAFVGVMVAGELSDRLAAKNRVMRLRLQAFSLLLGAPFIIMMAMGESLFWVYIGLGLFGLFRGMYDSNIYASLFSVTKEENRASVAASMIMFAYIIGSFAPTILGMMKPLVGLTSGLALLAVFYIVGGLLILWACVSSFHKDKIVE
ncbi:MFS transporter [Sinomicrobium sp.]